MEAGLLARAGGATEGVQFVRSFDGRLVGQSWETPFVDVPAGPITAAAVGEMVASFHDAYERRNGNRFTAFPVQGVTYRVQMIVPTPKVAYEKIEARGTRRPVPSGQVRLRYLYGDELAADEYERQDLRPGDTILGPSIIRESMSTTFVPPGRSLAVGDYGELVVE
jgi:N-methylhydantoinase A